MALAKLGREVDATGGEKARTLADVGAGFCGRIRDLVGDENLCVHLMEVGFTPGQVVQHVATSPLGDPVAFALRGTVIALRRREARCIVV